MTQNNLLPIGFYDLLFNEAEENHRKINIVIDYFLQNKYRLIKTPLVEFENNNQSNSFSFSDAISAQSLSLRSDITTQISRLFNTTLANIDLPLKICYHGDVILTKSDELYADRQSTQLGLEIIGADNNSKFEIVAMILQILPQIVNKKLSIEFSVPNFCELFCQELKIANNQQLINAIKSKNISLIQQNINDEEIFKIIKEITLVNNNIKKVYNDIALNLNENNKIRLKLEELLNIHDFISSNFPEIEIYFDLFAEDNSYHQDLSFDIFCEGLPYSIVRGGKYQLNNHDSFGATIYMNYLRKL